MKKIILMLALVMPMTVFAQKVWSLQSARDFICNARVSKGSWRD